MALETTQTSGLTGQYQVLFSKKLLSYAKQLLVMDQFAQNIPFPKNAGATQIRFFRPNVGDRTQVQTLSEGVPISTFRENTLTAITFTMQQFGEASKISDILSYTDLFNSLNMSVQSMGEDAALFADYQVLLNVVPNVNAANKHYSGGAATFNALNALTPAQGAMTLTDALWAMTKLTLQRAPYAKGGKYIGITAPQVAYDLLQDGKLIAASEYGSSKSMYNGEVGTWFGIPFIQTTQPWTEAGTNGTEGTFGTAGSGGTVYSTIFTGSQAYGTPIMAGQSPYSPKIIINDTPSKSDPLNQYITAGWKSYWASGVLNDTWFVVNRSHTTFA